MILTVAASAMFVAPCLGQTATSQPATTQPSKTAVVTGNSDLQRILAAKDSAIALADRNYGKLVESAEKSHEQSLSTARTSWSGQIADAKSAAITELKALGARLAGDGRLGEAVKVLQAVYALNPSDNETAKALADAEVNLKNIPAERDHAARSEGAKTSRIVIWNTHNGRHNTSGALQCNVILSRAGSPVWRSDKVDLPWERNKDTSVSLEVPAGQFDVVRVEVVKWKGYSGGLAEIEVWRGGKNVALRMPTRASAAADTRTVSSRVTDGVRTSSAYKEGYWLLPDKQAGWIEIDLARPAYSKLVRAKISAREPWKRVISVTEGDIVDITASGKWRSSPKIQAGPDGGLDPGSDQRGNFRDRFYLQGRFDRRVVKVGSRSTLRVLTDGYLELGMNEDKPDLHENNSGFLEVTVSIRKRPPGTESSSSGGNGRSVASRSSGGVQ
jgi:hypothetical protein